MLISTLWRQKMLHNAFVSVYVNLEQNPATERDVLRVLQHDLECGAISPRQRALELFMCRRSETKA